MAEGETHGAREHVAAPHAVLPADLVRGRPRAVRAEGQVHELVDRLQVLPGLVRRDLEVEVLRIDLRQRDPRPAPRLLHLELGGAHGLEVLLEGLTVLARERLAQGTSVLEQRVEGAATHGEALLRGAVLLDEQPVEDPLGAVLARDRAARAREGERVRPPRGPGAPVRREDEGVVARVLAHVGSEDLIQRDAVAVLPLRAGVGAGEELIRVRVAVDVAHRGVGEAREHGELVAQTHERFHALREAELLAAPVREPGPVLVRGVLLERHRHAVGEVHAGQPPTLLTSLLRGPGPGHGLEPGERQGERGPAQEAATVHRVHVEGRGHFHRKVESRLRGRVNARGRARWTRSPPPS